MDHPQIILRQAQYLNHLLDELSGDRGELAEAEKQALEARVQGYQMDSRTHGGDQQAVIQSLEPAKEVIDLKANIRIAEDKVRFWCLMIEHEIPLEPPKLGGVTYDG